MYIVHEGEVSVYKNYGAADEIKLDMSFTQEIRGDENHELFATVLCQAAQKREVEVCFEGVENKEMLDYLKEYGDILVQGYYFDKPLLPDEFERKYCK
jgi:EAL domain-containing protein (putative c-di-GMP-specific phosphodiesterase class I)